VEIDSLQTGPFLETRQYIDLPGDGLGRRQIQRSRQQRKFLGVQSQGIDVIAHGAEDIGGDLRLDDGRQLLVNQNRLGFAPAPDVSDQVGDPRMGQAGMCHLAEAGNQHAVDLVARVFDRGQEAEIQLHDHVPVIVRGDDPVGLPRRDGHRAEIQGHPCLVFEDIVKHRIVTGSRCRLRWQQLLASRYRQPPGRLVQRRLQRRQPGNVHESRKAQEGQRVGRARTGPPDLRRAIEVRAHPVGQAGILDWHITPDPTHDAMQQRVCQVGRPPESGGHFPGQQLGRYRSKGRQDVRHDLHHDIDVVGESTGGA